MAKTVFLLKNVKNTANDPLPPLTMLCECRESHEKTTLSQGEGEFGKFIFGHNIIAMIVDWQYAELPSSASDAVLYSVKKDRFKS